MAGRSSERRQVVFAEDRARAHDCSPLDHVGELAHVAEARGVGEQAVHRSWRDARRWLAQTTRVLAHEGSSQCRAIAAAFAKRRHANGEDGQPEEEVLPEAALLDGLGEVAVGRRHDAHVHAHGPRPSEPLELLLLQHAKQLRLEARGADSPTSSRSRVPPSASSKRPRRRWTAPVKAPFSCPKSSLSTSEGVRAAQLTRTRGPDRRDPSSCSARATSSLPVPVSPCTSTVVVVGATFRTSASVALIPSHWPSIVAASPSSPATSLRR